MKTSELIKQLQDSLEKHGDRDVIVFNEDRTFPVQLGFGFIEGFPNDKEAPLEITTNKPWNTIVYLNDKKSYRYYLTPDVSVEGFATDVSIDARAYVDNITTEDGINKIYLKNNDRH